MERMTTVYALRDRMAEWLIEHGEMLVFLRGIEESRIVRRAKIKQGGKKWALTGNDFYWTKVSVVDWKEGTT